MEKLNLENVVLQTLPAELVHEAALVAAKAFLSTNSCIYIYGEDEAFRLKELEILFETNISIVHSRNPETCFCAIDNSVTPGKLCCFFMLYGEDVASISFCEKVTNGMLWLPFRAGFGVYQRLMQIATYADASELEMVRPGEPFLRLARMVVHPDYQGKGVGSKCLKQAIEKANSDGMTIVLGTQQQQNVVFYSRMGFTVEKDVMWPLEGPKEVQFRWWYMKRVPTPSAATAVTTMTMTTNEDTATAAAAGK